ncbi:hypothetical protein BvRS1_57120 [Burkholderia vietnamiensis]|nr:hypothetical protein BconGalA64_35470 [Burkholderia contaminans]GBH28663.1 hypothetical protein BvRS1_57120 [Burkholderia vietnamiensis]
MTEHTADTVMPTSPEGVVVVMIFTAAPIRDMASRKVVRSGESAITAVPLSVDGTAVRLRGGAPRVLA